MLITLNQMTRDELEKFDWKQGDVLKQILSSRRRTNSLIEDLTLLVANKEPIIQTKATGLLKKLAENKVKFKTEHVMVLFDSLAELEDWESKLHVCQMLQHIEIPQRSEGSVVWFLERSLAHENKYLRAWAYNGFYELARQRQEYVDYAMEIMERGEAEKAAAVKARLRNIRKEMNRLSRKD
jgi:hypothetical protein